MAGVAGMDGMSGGSAGGVIGGILGGMGNGPARRQGGCTQEDRGLRLA